MVLDWVRWGRGRRREDGPLGMSRLRRSQCLRLVGGSARKRALEGLPVSSSAAAAAEENWSMISTFVPHSLVTSTTHKLESALCCSSTCDDILIRKYRTLGPYDRKSNQHGALRWRGPILCQAFISLRRPCSSIKEKPMHLLFVVVRGAALNCQAYGDDYWSTLSA